uniref:WD repeat domain phosphoinositide-interacting protein 2 n=1 Tax=Caenorhabditis japonica TaxID=281687 RepID=A0A8R1HMD6_CAEJA
MAKIINAAVNLEHTMFSISTQEGFKIFELHPVTYKCYENSIPDTGPVRIARQFARTNIVVYVSAKNGKYPQNVTWVFDAEGNKNRLEITTPGACGPVTNVHVCENRLVIFTAPRVFVYQFPKNPKQIRTEETRINPFGLSAMSYDPTTAACYLAYPGYKTGTVQILNLNTLTERESKAPVVIEAHLTDITQIALNCQGTLVATGSTKGTVIRVFDARTKGMLYELRRGTVQAHLSCISFSPCSSYLAVASDKGTLHVFGIRDSENQKKKNVLDLNRGSSSLMKFNLERDVLALGFTKQTTRSLQSLVAICSDGTYWQYHFSKDNGAMSYHQKADKFENLIEMVKDTEFWREPI